jgi:hypothetical protein
MFINILPFTLCTNGGCFYELIITIFPKFPRLKSPLKFVSSKGASSKVFEIINGCLK